MNYIEYYITTSPANETTGEILTAWLSDLPFETFEITEAGLKAFIQEEACNAQEIEDTINQITLPDTEISFTSTLIPRQNWNSEWEKNFFAPILIDDQCVIHSSFHTDIPDVPYKIVIDPKMSFGTGHHATTTLMVKQILKSDYSGKSFLDMGCGTGVLAILAALRGAQPVTAIDIDDWACENTRENIVTNHTPDIQVELGGAELLNERSFDIIFANINRNILLEDMPHYKSCLNANGTLIISGFYEEDIPILTEKAKALGFIYKSQETLNKWACVTYQL